MGVVVGQFQNAMHAQAPKGPLDWEHHVRFVPCLGQSSRMLGVILSEQRVARVLCTFSQANLGTARFGQEVNKLFGHLLLTLSHFLPKNDF